MPTEKYRPAHSAAQMTETIEGWVAPPVAPPGSAADVSDLPTAVDDEGDPLDPADYLVARRRLGAATKIQAVARGKRARGELVSRLELEAETGERGLLRGELAEESKGLHAMMPKPDEASTSRVRSGTPPRERPKGQLLRRVPQLTWNACEEKLGACEEELRERKHELSKCIQALEQKEGGGSRRKHRRKRSKRRRRSSKRRSSKRRRRSSKRRRRSSKRRRKSSKRRRR